VHLTRRGGNPQDFFILNLAGALLCLSLLVANWGGVFSRSYKSILVAYLCLVFFGVIVYSLIYIEGKLYGYSGTGKDMSKLIFLLGVGFGGFVCDALFIAITRRLLRWAAQMNSTSQVAWLIFVNVVLSLGLIGPALYAGPYHLRMDSPYSVRLTVEMVSLTNRFDVGFAMLFVLLAAILLMYRLFWPLLTRTLFRMQDVGTKGRRAILTTIGVALLGTSLFGGKFPELWGKIIEHLG